MFLKRRFWSHVVAIGAIAILFAACDDDSGSSMGPENEAELVEISSSGKETSSSSEKKISSSSVGKIKSSSSQKTILSSSASEPKSSSSVSKNVLSSSVEKSKSSSSATPESSSSSSQTVVLSSESHEESSGSSFNGWSWDVPKEARLNPEIAYGAMTDSRDGKTYKTVKIGNQTWMAENLNYADSAKTPSLKGKSWCYNNIDKNCDVAGRLYSWAAAMDSVTIGCGYGSTCSPTLPVRGICPEGWHLPSYNEWNALFTAVGGQSTAATALKSQSGWYNNGNGTDAFGFSALPAGSRRYYDGFEGDGILAIFWSASEDDRYYAYYVNLVFHDEYAGLSHYDKYHGFSVRCLKD